MEERKLNRDQRSEILMWRIGNLEMSQGTVLIL